MSFAVLPCATILNSPCEIGSYRLFKNRPADWQQWAVDDRGEFLSMYKDSQGRTQGSRVTVIAHSTGRDLEQDEVKQIVVLLSSIAWLKFRRRSAECWTFDVLERQGSAGCGQSICSTGPLFDQHHQRQRRASFPRTIREPSGVPG